MPLQDTYSNDLAFGYPGMVANGETSNRITRSNEDATAIPFGRAVFRGVLDHGCTATPNANPLGIAIATTALAILPSGSADAYPQYENVNIMTQGVVWVAAGESVTDGADAFVTSTGLIVDTPTGNTALPGWKFDTTGANGALVKLAKR